MSGNGPTTPRHHAIAIGVSVLTGIALASVLALAAASLGWDFGLTAQTIESTIQSWGMWGVGASVGLMVAHSFVPFPAEFLAIANGMVYGPLWGTLITWSGAMLGGLLAFGLARWLGRPFVELLIVKRGWHKTDEWTGRQGVYVVLASRFIPVIAFNVINYAAGLSRISWWTFTWTTALGILPLTMLMVVMGHNIHSLAWESWVLLFAAGLVLWLVLRRRLRPPADRPDGPDA